jgi:hypothetical protein
LAPLSPTSAESFEAVPISMSAAAEALSDPAAALRESTAASSSTSSASSPTTDAALAAANRPFSQLTSYERMMRIGENLLYGIDTIGEWVCNFTGLSKSKFQYVIDAQNREKFYVRCMALPVRSLCVLIVLFSVY